MTADGNALTLPAPVLLVGDTLYAPLRLFTAGLGWQGNWEVQANKVRLTPAGAQKRRAKRCISPAT